MICILFVVISAFALYFVAFCQRLIYEYMDVDRSEFGDDLEFISTFFNVVNVPCKCTLYVCGGTNRYWKSCNTGHDNSGHYGGGLA